jgi:hypothetical protein
MNCALVRQRFHKNRHELSQLVLCLALIGLGDVSRAAADPVVLRPILDIVGGVPSETTAASITYGWWFSLSQSVTVNGIGIWDEGGDGLLPGTVPVALWRRDGTLLATGIVGDGAQPVSSIGTSGTWLFDRFASPLTLDIGEYVVGALYSRALQEPLRVNATTVTLPGVTYLGGAFGEAEGLRFPSTIFEIPNQSRNYFGPNLLTDADRAFPEPPPPVPEPASAVLVATGVMALLANARRLRRDTPDGASVVDTAGSAEST